MEVGEVIELTIIAAHGDAQDIRFTVGDLSAQTILINMGESSTAQRVALKPEISKMMRAMIEGKKGKYYIVHFKELFALDGKPTDFEENDLARRNTIAKLLAEWGLIEIVPKATNVEQPIAPLSQIKIISYKEIAIKSLLFSYNQVLPLNL